MSTTHSIDTDSTSSSNTMPTRSWNEQQIDPSNILYNDHQNYQIIFTNDSRFFDTSLHLFKSYRDLGYIPLDNKKSKKKVYFLLQQILLNHNQTELIGEENQNEQDLVVILILMEIIMEHHNLHLQKVTVLQN